MTRQQERKIEVIRNYMNGYMGRHSDGYEMKEEHIEELGVGGIVSVVMETGMKEDEGTMAAILCRNRIHVFIGPKGGVTCISRNRKTGGTCTYEDTWLGVVHRSMEDHNV